MRAVSYIKTYLLVWVMSSIPKCYAKPRQWTAATIKNMTITKINRPDKTTYNCGGMNAYY